MICLWSCSEHQWLEGKHPIVISWQDDHSLGKPGTLRSIILNYWTVCIHSSNLQMCTFQADIKHFCCCCCWGQVFNLSISSWFWKPLRHFLTQRSLMNPVLCIGPVPPSPPHPTQDFAETRACIFTFCSMVHAKGWPPAKGLKDYIVLKTKFKAKCFSGRILQRATEDPQQRKFWNK